MSVSEHVLVLGESVVKVGVTIKDRIPSHECVDVPS
jgi:hypothetical protein